MINRGASSEAIGDAENVIRVVNRINGTRAMESAFDGHWRIPLEMLYTRWFREHVQANYSQRLEQLGILSLTEVGTFKELKQAVKSVSKPRQGTYTDLKRLETLRRFGNGQSSTDISSQERAQIKKKARRAGMSLMWLRKRQGDPLDLHWEIIKELNYMLLGSSIFNIKPWM